MPSGLCWRRYRNWICIRSAVETDRMSRKNIHITSLLYIFCRMNRNDSALYHNKHLEWVRGWAASNIHNWKQTSWHLKCSYCIKKVEQTYSPPVKISQKIDLQPKLWKWREQGIEEYNKNIKKFYKTLRKAKNFLKIFYFDSGIVWYRCLAPGNLCHHCSRWSERVLRFRITRIANRIQQSLLRPSRRSSPLALHDLTTGASG